MRSKFLLCAAIAAAGSSHWLVSVAHAADAKSKSSEKAKPTELHADDKSMKKQTQWEDKVMGPDSKRAELDKIARARAITAKAEKDKEKQAALEAATPAPKVAPGKIKNEKSELSLLPASAEEKSDNRTHEISPKLATEAAKAAPAPVKPADDKFIDKLLREEDSPTRKRASSSSDKELESLLAGAKEKPTGHKRGDTVDDLIKTADKGPAMPAPRAQSGLPDWAKQPEIAPTPAPPPPVAMRAASKNRSENSGVIQVVQGAAGDAPAVVSSSHPAPVASRPGRNGKGMAKATTPVAWSDPFADKRPVSAAPKKEAASRPSASTDTSWNDPFATEPNDARKATTRHTPAAPASAPRKNDRAEPASRPAGSPGPGSAGWKDPFTKAPAEPARARVAMRELAKGESSKWEIAARRPVARATASDAHAAGGWGVLKKRAR